MSYPGPHLALRSWDMELRRIPSGALAGAVAAAVWAAQQPLDKRLFGSDYDDVEVLGKLVTRDSGWQAAGLAIHMANGAAFGAVYALLRPFLPGPPQLAGVAAGLGEHLATWPLTALVDRDLAGDRRAFAQSAWRHALFGLVLGELERRLNPAGQFEPLEQVPVSSNGHGNIEHAAAGATEAP
jgi:xanthosine utilization system XapX-like protein